MAVEFDVKGTRTKEHQRNLVKVAEDKGKVTPADVKREVGKITSDKSGPIVYSLKELAVTLARHVIVDDQTFEKMESLAKEVLEAAGEKL